MNGTFTKLALTDGTNTVVLSNIADGVDGATFFILTVEPRDPVTVEDGQTLHNGTRYNFDMRALHTSAAGTQLTTWATNRTVLKASAITLNGAAISERLTISNNDQISSLRVIALQCSIEDTGRGYGKDGTKGLALSTNLLAANNVLNGVNNLYGFDATGFTTSISGQKVELVTSVGTDTWFSDPVFFPYPGYRLRASLRFDTPMEEGGTMGIRFLNAAGGVISTVTEAYTTADEASRVANDAVTVPALTHSIQFVFISTGSTAGLMIVVELPNIATDGVTEFVL
jgi:hypothetical protein